MFSISSTVVITFALMTGLYGQFLIHFRTSRPYVYQNDVITCIVRSRGPLFLLKMGLVSANIVIRQHLTNGTQVDLTTCPVDSELDDSTCSAILVNLECKGTARLTCSVIDFLNNATESRGMQIRFLDTTSVGSFYTRYKGADNYSSTQTFLPGALVKLICIGNVSMVTGRSFKKLTLSRRNGILHLQNLPTVNVLKNWDNECTVQQQVSVFLYLKEEEHSYSEFRCGTERRYIRWRGKTPRKYIRLKTEKESYIHGPETVTTDESEDRVLLSMTCDAMTNLDNSTDVADIRWCIRKENDTRYVSLPLQERPNGEAFNTSLGRKLTSVVLYQLLKSDRNVEIICETNYSETCGSGALRGSAVFNEDPMEKMTNTSFNSITSAAADVVCDVSYVYVATAMMVVGVASLIAGVIACCKVKQRVKSDNSSSTLDVLSAKRHDVQVTPTAMGNLEGHSKQQEQVYENRLVETKQGLKQVYELNETHIDAAGEMYEALNANVQEPHIYEGKSGSGELYEVV
ncbi:uncharacterized protein LOC125675550 isoform X2 [Ostrea edulis]|uniref:uncharacterized protein LOC125675550 isoform X2 n=1 Tax=Ostrea edulis TaxID=37623 RepID=UPI0024AFBA79|nr:uncharacterized protein LOC125675550 isoform X2 [Ostrea edulis]